MLGDCGAFTYVREKVPPYSVDEVLQFYTACDFDLGISVDHVILDFQPRFDALPTEDVPADLRERQRITLELAAEFWTRCRHVEASPAASWRRSRLERKVLRITP